MILLSVGAEMLARLMAAEGAPDTAWLLAGPTEVAVEAAADGVEADEIEWRLAAE
ncbi:MAG TPA: hypothetical protein VEA15_03345 [Caulobacteraceae bacterium]|nr:hypothetical protein [Caulobacteraceae bacterium]